MDGLKLAIEKFETFIKRSLMPSSSFLMMFILFDIYSHEKNPPFLTFLKEEHHSLMLITLFIAFAGFSTLLTILHQFVYDNWIKANYTPLRLFRSETKDLEELRGKVIEKLIKEDRQRANEHLTDYRLYQIIGGEFNTKRYVDDVKTIGIFFVSLLIIIIMSISKHIAHTKSLFELNNFFWFIGGIFLLYLFYQLGKELILSKYRSRAIRIYTNFLNKKG